MSDEIVLGIKRGLITVISNPSNLPIMIKDYDTDGMDKEQYDLLHDERGDFTIYEPEDA